MQNRRKLLKKIADLLSDSEEFKQFHGKVEFNFAFGQVKKFGANEIFLNDSQKKP